MKKYFNFIVLGLFLSTGANAQRVIPKGSPPNYKSSVASVAALPATGNTAGDTRVALSTSNLYIWTGSAWQGTGSVAVDSSGNFVSPGIPSASIVTITSASSPYTVGATDYLILVDSTGGAITVNLPNPNTNKRLKIKGINGSLATNNLTLSRFGSEKIEGLNASLVLSSPNGNYEFQSDGTNWWKVSTANNPASLSYISSTTWVPQAGISLVNLYGRGGSGGGAGGGSGGGASTTTAAAGGGGGGSGGSAISNAILNLPVMPGSVYSITIGAGGSAGAGGTAAAANVAGVASVLGAAGGTGGTTSLGSLARFNGGTSGSIGSQPAAFGTIGQPGNPGINTFAGTGVLATVGGAANVAGTSSQLGPSTMSVYGNPARNPSQTGGAAGGANGGGGGGCGGSPSGGDFSSTTLTGTPSTPGAGGASGAAGGNATVGTSSTAAGAGGFGGAAGGGGGVLAVTGSQGGNGANGTAGNAGQLVIEWQE